MNNDSKHMAYRHACANKAMAYNANGQKCPLSDCNIDDVEFVAGLWRIQNKFNHNIQKVRGTEFVLHEKINRTEKNLFEFYRASPVAQNCYGRFIIKGTEQIVAKYETDDETFWAYGNSIEQARAFLGICLYDKYQDLIHATACKSRTK